MNQPHGKSGEVTNIALSGPLSDTATSEKIAKAAQLEVIRLVLRAGKAIPEHQAPGEITVLCLTGTVSFTETGTTHVLNQGDFLHLKAKTPHALKSISDASLLLTKCIVDE